MCKLEIYSYDYDVNQDVVNGGLNGKVFVTTDTSHYECYNVVDALDGLEFDAITEIVLYYQKDG